MKRIGVLIAALTLATGVCADGISFTGWGRSVFLPYVSQTGGDPYVTIGNSYGNTPELDINAVGTSANVGFEYDFKFTGAAIATGNNAFVWIAPVEGVRLAVGSLVDWTLQSNGTTGEWNFLRFSYTGENFTFSRIKVKGAELSYTQGPLFAYLALDNLLYGSAGGPAAFKANDLPKNATAGAGFKFDNVGSIKAQVIGAANASKDLYQIVNVAVDFTGLDNLWSSVGVYLNTDSADQTFGNDSKVKGLLRLDGAASYTLDAVKITGLVEYVGHKTGDPNLEFGAGVDYALDDGWTILGSVRSLNKAAGTEHLAANAAVTGAFVGVNKSFGTGNLGVGIAYSTSTFATWGAPLIPGDDPTKAHFAIPVRVDYSF